MHWIQNELQIQKHDHQAAESNDELIDSDEYLPGVLEDRKAERQILQKKRRDEGHLPTTPEEGYDFFAKLGKGKPGWMPSSQVFNSSHPGYLGYLQEHESSMNELHERPQPAKGGLGDDTWRRLSSQMASDIDNMNQRSRSTMNAAGRGPTDLPTIEITRLTPPSNTMTPLKASFRRLSVEHFPESLPVRPKEPPDPLPCRHNQWLPHPQSCTCHSCNQLADGQTYYCPKCSAQICGSCFRAAQPKGGQVEVSSHIFRKGAVDSQVNSETNPGGGKH